MDHMKKKNYYVGLIASIYLIIYAILKLNQFFAPKVGPVGNGPSDTVVAVVWVLFGISMILGLSGVIYFSYSIIKTKR